MLGIISRRVTEELFEFLARTGVIWSMLTANKLRNKLRARSLVGV
jgi:hypothetical protein